VLFSGAFSHGQSIHRLIWSAHPVSVLGKVYLGVSLALFVVGVVWASNTLQANAAWVEIVLAVPRFDLIEPLQRIRYEVNLAVLLAGWVVAVGVLGLLAMRAPFKIRSAAITARRLRELEREVLALRTLPLRQQEEDELLAADAHLDAGTKKVMTEKLRRDDVLAARHGGSEGRAQRGAGERRSQLGRRDG
jgi:hypothetical protein